MSYSRDRSIFIWAIVVLVILFLVEDYFRVSTLGILRDQVEKESFNLRQYLDSEITNQNLLYANIMPACMKTPNARVYYKIPSKPQKTQLAPAILK